MQWQISFSTVTSDLLTMTPGNRNIYEVDLCSVNYHYFHRNLRLVSQECMGVCKSEAEHMDFEPGESVWSSQMLLLQMFCMAHCLDFEDSLI